MRPEQVQAGGGEDDAVAATRPIRVLVVDVAWWWREALVRVLERTEAFVPIAASDRKTAVRLLRDAHPDVVVVDLDDDEGLSILAAARERDLPAIALSSKASHEQVSEALGFGASYVVKSELDPERFRHLVTMAANGDALLVRASSRFLRNLAGGRPSDRYHLTRRESEVLNHLALGHTNAEIAASLHLAPSSVKKLVSRVLARLGVRNRVEAALVARQEGLVTRADDDVREVGRRSG
ncbi:MAG: DNA-binding response regulator [Gaiellaceae bacterium]